MSLRFIKNRLADFGMIKPAEFLSPIFFVCYIGLMNVYLVLLQTIWIKIVSIRASMSECRKVKRLS